MSVTEKVLRLYEVDRQLRGLRKRIDAAQRYLDEQERQVEQIKAKQESLSAQKRQLEATIHNEEQEMASIDERIGMLRERMQTAQTNKEYSAVLTEVNTLKADRGSIEERALESMSRVEEIKAQLTTLEQELAERAKIRDVAGKQRDERKKEVADRVEELESDRKAAARDVPADVLEIFEEAVRRHDEDALAPIEEHSRRHLEYACGACSVLLPIELVNAVLSRGEITQCSSCSAILYMHADLRESMTPAAKR